MGFGSTNLNVWKIVNFENGISNPCNDVLVVGSYRNVGI
jgi:hypothetical protein